MTGSQPSLPDLDGTLSMHRWIDAWLDRITMYRVLVYYLGGLLLVAFVLSVTGSLGFSPFVLILSTALLLAVSWVSNVILALIFRAPTNGAQSAVITALILALIITPDTTKTGIAFVCAAAGLAMASKYILTIRRKHIFNPAAIAVVLTAWGSGQTASWWVGSTAMLPWVVIGGLLVVRKVRRVAMVVSFLASTTILTVALTWLTHGNVLTGLHNMVFSSAVLFLGFVMLTEPLTSPGTQRKQVWYGALVGALVPPQVHVLSFYTSPEIALVIGNIFSYIISPKTKLFPVLKEKLEVARHTFDFVFYPEQRFAYAPGQYMEFTVPHDAPDERGSRRYFTLASSPTEKELRIGVKFYEPSSTYKQALLALEPSSPMTADQLAGDFTLPDDPQVKLAFLAGGIGITPFRSMAKYLTDTNQHRDVVLLYAAQTRHDVAYSEIFEAARAKIGMRTTYVLTKEPPNISAAFVRGGVSITSALIAQEIPDYHERTFYLSGTHDMVTALRVSLLALGVSKRHIKIDFFPGY